LTNGPKRGFRCDSRKLELKDGSQAGGRAGAAIRVRRGAIMTLAGSSVPRTKVQPVSSGEVLLSRAFNGFPPARSFQLDRRRVFQRFNASREPNRLRKGAYGPRDGPAV